jgi:hypothetical protein
MLKFYIIYFIIYIMLVETWIFLVVSRDSSVGTATGYELDSWGSILGRGPQRPDRIWGPPKLLRNGYRGYRRKADL